jgi:uncharacterized membrane protein
VLSCDNFYIALIALKTEFAYIGNLNYNKTLNISGYAILSGISEFRSVHFSFLALYSANMSIVLFLTSKSIQTWRKEKANILNFHKTSMS